MFLFTPFIFENMVCLLLPLGVLSELLYSSTSALLYCHTSVMALPMQQSGICICSIAQTVAARSLMQVGLLV